MKVGSFIEKPDLDFVAALVPFRSRKFRQVGLAVERLMNVSNEVDYEFQRFQSGGLFGVSIAQHACKTLDRLDNAVAARAVAGGVIFCDIEWDVDKVPWSG